MSCCWGVISATIYAFQVGSKNFGETRRHVQIGAWIVSERTSEYASLVLELSPERDGRGLYYRQCLT